MKLPPRALRGGSWGELKCRFFKWSKRWKLPLKFNWFFYRFLTFTSFKRDRKQNYIYELSSDNKILSSFVKKTCRTCTFVNTSGKQMSNYYAPCFNRTDFFVISSCVKLPFCTLKYLLANDFAGIKTEACQREAVSHELLLYCSKTH